MGDARGANFNERDGLGPENVMSTPVLLLSTTDLFFIPPFSSGTKMSNILSIYSGSGNSIAFKVKTTAPVRYSVKPRAGVLSPGTLQEVYITLHPDEEFEPSNKKDKFLVEYRLLDPSEEGLDERALWSPENASPSTVHQQKLIARFCSPPKNEYIVSEVPESSNPVGACVIVRPLYPMNSDSRLFSSNIQSFFENIPNQSTSHMHDGNLSMDFPGSLGDISGLNIDMDALMNPNADAASSTVQLKMELRTLYSRLGDIEHQLNLSRRELQESKGQLRSEKLAHQSTMEELHRMRGDEDSLVGLSLAELESLEQILKDSLRVVEKARRDKEALEIRNLNSSIGELKDQMICKICFDRRLEVAFQPCGHLCVCAECSERVVSNCPLCRTPIKNRIRLNF